MRSAVTLKRVLFLAYYFPPIGGAGVQRSAKFARYLPAYGYEPVVVTGPGPTEGRWTPTDFSLKDELPPMHVIRLDRPVPPRPAGWQRRSERWLRRGSAFADWWIEGLVRVAEHVADVDLVYASMSPFETAVAAERIAGRLCVPWVADLRDPWALDEMTVYPTSLHRTLERRAMRSVLRSASAVVMNTREAARAAKQLLGASAYVTWIANGYDSADFSAPPHARRSDRFQILHTGYLHTELGYQHRRNRRLRRLLGGAADVDFLTRSHVFLLEAVSRLLRREPAARDFLEIGLVGVLSEADHAVIAASDARALVHTPGYVSHSQVVMLLREAHLLFLPMHDLPNGQRARIVPGKTYEYLASGTPILGAVPQGDARELLVASGNASVCAPSNVECLSSAIAHHMTRHFAGERVHGTRIDVLLPYERRALTSELAQVFDAVLPRSRW